MEASAKATPSSSSKARLARIFIFPFKSLDRAAVDSATLDAAGALDGDRAFALFDADGGIVNGKREPLVHRLRVCYSPDLRSAMFTSETAVVQTEFALDDDPQRLEPFLVRHFGRAVTVRRRIPGGFPDDTAAPGPTLVSTATLAAIAEWFPELDPASVGRRFRANLVVDGVPAFWEDRLYGAHADVAFRIGAATLLGAYPCARCVVPSRDPRTGAAIAAFQKTVAERRAATLPPWAARERFDHFYRLTVNTRGASPGSGATLHVGDEVSAPPAVERDADARTDPGRGRPG